MKKTIYIAIEIKVREFLSKILLAHHLAMKNYRVVLGSKDEILKYIENKNTKGGVFFYKAGVHKDFIKILNKKVDVHATIDQEMSPGYGLKTYERIIPNSFHEKTLNDIDLYYCLNKVTYLAAKNTLGHSIKDIQFTGWPRFELFKKKYRNLFDHKVKKIKKKYGDFILFNSDFLFNSKYYKERALQYPPWGLENQKKKLKEHKKFILNHAKNNHIEFLETVDFFKKISNKINYKIVIRPHPGENIKAWQEKLKNIKNVYIETAIDDVHPWIMACNGLLHRGCTTSYQSLYIKKPVGYLMAVNTKDKRKFYEDSWNFKKIPFKYSTKINNLVSLKKWLKNPKKLSKRDIKIIETEIGLNKLNPCKLIYKSLQKYKINKEKKPKIQKVSTSKVKYYYYVLRNIILRRISVILTLAGILQKNIDKFDMVPKIPGGITVKEVNFYNKLLDKSVINKKFKTNTYKIGQDLVVIERT